MVKELSVYLVGLIMLIFAIRYSYQIWRQQISPALSTWIIFFFGTLISLITYALAEHHDFRSGILNTMDVLAMAVIVTAILIWGNRKVPLKSFEKWYLGAILMIIAYGFISGNALSSNIFMQIVLIVGYIPTIQNLLREKRNTESFTGWGLALAAGAVALYPAIANGNFLAVIYAGRTVFFVSIILLFMTYYKLKSTKIDQ